MNTLTFEGLALQRSPLITFSYVMQVFLSLLIILALIYVTAKFLLPKFKITGISGKLIKIVDRIYLEPQVSAYILKVGKLAWLIVVSNKQISRIDRLEEDGLA
jgi:flagellar biogenesis protein FliO